MEPERNGFSLLEMLAVLAVMALAAGLIAPAVGNQIPRFAIKSDARAVAQLLKAAQMQAIAQHRPVVVTADLTAGSFSIGGATPVIVDKHTAITVTAAFDTQTDDGNPRFVFFPDGTTTGGRIELMRGGAVLFIDANWLSGHVRTYAG